MRGNFLGEGKRRRGDYVALFSPCLYVSENTHTHTAPMATMAAACLMSPAALVLSRPHSYQGVLLKALHLGSSFCPPTHTLVLPPLRETDSFHNSRSRLHFSPLAPPRHGFSVKALDVSGPGSIDSPLINSMEMKIKEQLKADEVTVKDAYGDGRHVSIDVISTAFEGQSSVNRQRMVYKAIWEELQNAVHAVDHMRTRTPAEAAQEPLNK